MGALVRRKETSPACVEKGREREVIIQVVSLRMHRNCQHPPDMIRGPPHGRYLVRKN